jgi:WD40 repeat protein
VRTAANTVAIFSLDTLKPQSSLTIPHAGTITALAWSHTGSELAVGGDRGLLQLWDVSGTPRLMRALNTLRPTSHLPEAIQSVAFSADDRLIAASDAEFSSGVYPSPIAGRVAIWRTGTGAPVTAALKLGTPASEVAFSPDGRRLAVATGDALAGDGRVLILDSSNGTRIRTIHPREADAGGTTSLAFAPNGTLATGAGAGIVQLWSPSTGDPIGHPVLAASAPIDSIAFDRSGQRFATAGGPEGGLKLWFTSSLQQDGATLDPEQGTWGSAQFTPNGQLLLAVNANGQGSVWPVSPAALEKHACAVAGRTLTPDEWSEFISGHPYSQVCPGR